jgi:two-component system OmpR family response regulator
VQTPPRILIVEDDESLRDGLTVLLRREGYDVDAAEDALGAVESASRTRPDVAVLDVRLPTGPDGFSIARTLRQDADIPILFLTAADSEEDRLAGFEAGADDYVVKPFSAREVAARIRVILRRAGRTDGDVLHVGPLRIDEPGRTVSCGDDVLTLTSIEFDLLVTLARHRGKVLSKLQLLSHVWGYVGHSENVVEARVSGLRRKLSESCGSEIVETVRGAGYVIR